MADLGDFIRLWTHPDYPPKRVEEGNLRQVEQRFDMAFPPGYREGVLLHGAPAPTIALLDSIVENDINLSDIAEFFTPDEIISATEDWREMRLPETLVAFAGDSMGNLFAFDQRASGVWFFDHDTGEVRQVSASFETWLAQYCELPPGQID